MVTVVLHHTRARTSCPDQSLTTVMPTAMSEEEEQDIRQLF